MTRWPILLPAVLGWVLASRIAGARSRAPKLRRLLWSRRSHRESYLLAEVFAQLLESHGIQVVRRPGLGATEIAFGALRSNAIDVYPEYTGTGLLAILHDPLDSAMKADPRQTYAHVARRFAANYGVRWLAPLGFQNGYAIAVRRETASRYGLRTLSDLARAGPELVAGFTATSSADQTDWRGCRMRTACGSRACARSHRQ
jgi:osmoprotectant transport system permease protein